MGDRTTDSAGRDGRPCRQQQTAVVTQPSSDAPQQAAVAVIRPRSNFYFALCVTICANPLFGIIAIVFSMISSSKADEGDIDQARKFSKISLVLCIVGIIVSAILAVTLFITLYLVPNVL